MGGADTKYVLLMSNNNPNLHKTVVYIDKLLNDPNSPLIKTFPDIKNNIIRMDWQYPIELLF